jgi:hypothetical protein
MKLKQKFGNGEIDIMAKVLSSIKTPERNHQNFVIATTNSSDSKRTRFPQTATPVEYVERFIAKSPNSNSRNYFSLFDEQSKTPISENTAVREISRFTHGKNNTFNHNLSGLNSKISGSFAESVIPRLPPKQQEIKANKESESESDEIEPFWRGVFALPSSSEVLFSKRIQIKLDELPSWEPYIAIDSYRFDGENEDDEF